MGTRADFFIGHGATAEYLGSVAWDGYRWHKKRPNAICDAQDEGAFRVAVAKELETLPDATTPKMGWPWPWKTTATTDYTYVWTDGTVEIYKFGSPAPVDPEADCDDTPERTDWRDMTDVQAVTMGPRSGLIVLGPAEEGGNDGH